MNKLLILCLMLSACGKPQNQESILVPLIDGSNGYVPVNPNGCNLPIVGQFHNQALNLDANIYDQSGVCMVSLSCGLIGYITDLGGNEYNILVSVSANSTSQCGWAQNNILVQLGNYSGQWLGFFTQGFNNVPSGNVWTKL